MAKKAKVDEILNGIESLTVLELSELVEKIEEKFGVQAYAPVIAQQGVSQLSSAETATTVEEKTEFEIVLIDTGEKKIPVLKEVKAITGLGLKEAKDLIANLPKPVKEGVSKEEAEKIKQTLESLGAKVELK